MGLGDNIPHKPGFLKKPGLSISVNIAVARVMASENAKTHS